MNYSFSRTRPNILQIAIVILALVFILLCAYIAITHLVYPYEIDWYEGAVLEHSLQLFDGKQVYAAPTVDFVSSLYQPLYLYASAAIMALSGEGYFAGRVISILACTGIGMMLFSWTRRLTQSSFYAVVAVGLFLGAYDVTGYTYSLARIDSLLLFLIVASFFVLQQKVSTGRAILAGVLCALAFFTKQQALFYMPFLALWLVMRSRKHTLIYLGTAAVLIVAGIAWFQASTEGWYLFYVFDIPRAKGAGFGWIRTLTVIPLYLLRYWGVGVLLILIYLITAPPLSLKAFISSDRGLVLLFFLAALLQAAMHRGDQMSYTNVYIPLAAAAAITIVIAAHQLSLRAELAAIGSAALCLQLIALLYDPRTEPKILLTAEHRAADAEFIEILRAMPGEVLMPSHGFLQRLAGKQGHMFELCAIDVMTAKGAVGTALKRNIDAAYLSGKFAAILIDSNVLTHPDSIQGYTLAGRLDRGRFGSRIGPTLTRPTYIYHPKR